MSVPDRIYMKAPELTAYQARAVALDAVAHAKRYAPKMTGQSSNRFEPLYGPGFFGIRWLDTYVWYQELGIRPFTMRSLAGKTIPMWVSDEDGSLRRQNPKIKTRTSVDGRTQVLIFRRAARIGQRKTVLRNGQRVDVPASYPGAPGRIALRNDRGQIARGNVGVRWRHPGLNPRSFLYKGMAEAAIENGVDPGPIFPSNDRWR